MSNAYQTIYLKPLCAPCGEYKHTNCSGQSTSTCKKPVSRVLNRECKIGSDPCIANYGQSFKKRHSSRTLKKKQNQHIIIKDNTSIFPCVTPAISIGQYMATCCHFLLPKSHCMFFSLFSLFHFMANQIIQIKSIGTLHNTTINEIHY